MKHFIAIVCLLIFSFQVLPVRQLGKLLCKWQNTEEVHDMGGDNSIIKEKKADAFKLCSSYSQTEHLVFFEKPVMVSLQATDHLPDYYVADILTPPPNCG